MITGNGGLMQRSRVEAVRKEKQRRKRRRNTLLVINLAMLVIIAGITIGGAWTGLLDLGIFKPDGASSAAAQGQTAAPSPTVVKDEVPAQTNAKADAETETDAQPEIKPEHHQPDASMDQDSSSESIKLTFVGDIINAGKVAAVVEKYGYDYPYTYVKDLFTQDDLTIANLETPITSRGVPAPDKQFVYKSSPKMADAMKTAGIDVVNLANNHILDQGEQGLLDTFSLLTKSQINYVGAGKDMEEAYRPAVIEKKGISIAVFGFSRVIPEVSWYAGKNKPGVAATYDPIKAVEAIKKVRDQVDLVIVIPHWGKEKEDQPVDYQRSLAKAYIDAGADLIVGGHPHVLQGFESYKGKWIAYSMGNFIFTRAEQPKTWETMVLEATCTKDGHITLQMKPYYTELGRAVPMDTAEAEALIKRVESISYHTSIDIQGRVTTP